LIQFVLPELTRSATLDSGIRVAWPWFALIGSSVTFFVGWAISTSSRFFTRGSTT
jgi:hypothetical protein